MIETQIIPDSPNQRFIIQTFVNENELRRNLDEAIRKSVIDKVADRIIEKHGVHLEESVLKGSSPEAIAMMVNAKVMEKIGEKIADRIQSGNIQEQKRFSWKHGLL